MALTLDWQSRIQQWRHPMVCDWRNRFSRLLLCAVLVMGCATMSQAQQAPDLTHTNLDLINTTANYSLGPTGLRGWIYVAKGGRPWSRGLDESMTDERPYQVLVVCVGTNTPASGVFKYQDVILGVSIGSNHIPIPLFTNDTRKAIGRAIGDAEAGDGWMNFSVWRGGKNTTLSIRLPIRGLAYSATAPYNCPKSALILSNAVAVLGAQPLANPISGLALLAAGGNNNLPKIQTYARGLTSAPAGGKCMWGWGYNGLFLAEYYLKTGDTEVLPVLNEILIRAANGTDRYGTTCHSESYRNDDGSYNGTSCGYGPVNQAGLAANLGLVMGRKCLVSAGMRVDPAINAAITRGVNFFGWHVQKGEIQYGEHNPWGGGSHAANGKHGLAAVLFAMVGDQPQATEYWTRMTLAGYVGRELGHTGQGFSYLWDGMGVNMAGPHAMAAYVSNIRWHLDLERCSDGSFAYDGHEQYGPSSATNYWTYNAYYNFVDPTASYILTYAAPLKQIYLTGRNANPAHVLSPDKVTDALWSAMIYTNKTLMTKNQLIAGLGAYDPTVRWWVAEELAGRPGVDLASIINLCGSPNAWLRASACTVLGTMKNTNSLVALGQCLSDSDLSVRAHAAVALKWFDGSASPLIPTMLTACRNNAMDPKVVDWRDPLQFSNGLLIDVLLGGHMITRNHDGLAPYTAQADRSLLWPVLRFGLRAASSMVRGQAASFVANRCTVDDMKMLTPELIECATTPVWADPMWRSGGRLNAIQALGKYHCPEALTVGLRMMCQPWVALGRGDEGDLNSQASALKVIGTFGDSARWTLPTLNNYLNMWASSDERFPALVNAINGISTAANSPTLTNLFPVARSQVVATPHTAAITLTGFSCRTNAVSFRNVTTPSHGVLTGTPPNLTYTATPGYAGQDRFTFQVADPTTNSDPATVSIIVGKAGTGLEGEYYENMDFTSLKFTRTDPQINFDWGAGAPTNTMRPDQFSVCWKGMLLAPEDGTYTFSAFSGGGVQMYVGGVPVIDDWDDEGRHWSDGTGIRLAGGTLYAVQMNFSKAAGDAVAKLKWSGPSFAGSNGVLVGPEWLYVSSGQAKVPVCAYPQRVTMAQNTNLLIILGGTHTNYLIASKPANGSLRGTPPRVTYTPAPNYVGADSFTFRVRDGVTASAAATVSINVRYGNPVSYFWTSAVGGVWSAGGNWTSTLNTVTPPLPDGQPNYSLNFIKSGTYSVTNDLNHDFCLNQMNFKAAVTVEGNGICVTNNGRTLPEINQDSASTVTLNVPLTLGTTTTIGGIAGGEVKLNRLISGRGGLVINAHGNFTILNKTNTYSGGTIVNHGVLGGSPDVPFLGTGPVVFNPSAVYAQNCHDLTNSFFFNGAKISGGNGFPSRLKGPVTLQGITTIDLGTGGGFAISGNITGSGGFYQSRGGLSMFSGTNTYTGPTTICLGEIIYAKSASVAPGALIICGTNSAVAGLGYTGTRNISSLTLGGVNQPAGTYGSTNSTATYKSTYFGGNGTVTVAPYPPGQ